MIAAWRVTELGGWLERMFCSFCKVKVKVSLQLIKDQAMNIQGASGGKVNVLGGHSISYSKKK
jgi:hypothetical protein